MFKKLSLPRWSVLLMGLVVYTSIGALFLLPNVIVRVIAFAILWVAWGRPRVSVLVLLVSCIIATGVSFILGQPVDVALARGASWAAVAGTILVGLVIYPYVFQGADWASVALPFGRDRGTDVARAGFLTFKIIPEFEDRIRRIGDALRVYGHRKYAANWKAIVMIVIDGLLIYFLEAIDILLANERILIRRRSILYDAAGTRRTISLLNFLGSCLFVMVVFAGFYLV